MTVLVAEQVLGWLADDPRRVLLPLGLMGLMVGTFAMRRRGGIQRDPQRAFTAAQRLRIHSRAGNRCEMEWFWWFRCSAPGTHADHVHPHSRGGASSLANGASTCARHNLRKGAKVPSAFTLWRLERRRRGYFPPGEPVEVTWRLPGP